LVFFKLEGAGGTLDFLSALPSTPPYYIPGYVDASHLTSGLTFTAGWGGDIVGTAYADKLMAGSGYGGRILDGGGGDDVLIGGFGDNTLKGGPGHDRLDGGGGTDRADYRDKTTAVVVTLNGLTDAVVKVGGFAEDTIRNIEGVLGGSGNDTLTGDANSNVLNGGAGNDKLVGGDGVDRLTGGLGADHLYGGSDGWGDFFIYTRLSDSTVAVSGRDIIEDFSESDGDQIDLRLVRTSAPDGNFHFIGTAAFSRAPGELRYTTQSGNAYVYGDADGDAVADFSIQLNHLTTLQAKDFVF
jgi:serralysin